MSSHAAGLTLVLFQLNMTSCRCQDCCVLLIKYLKSICLWEKQAAFQFMVIVWSEDQENCAQLSFPGSHGAGMCLLNNKQRNNLKSPKTANAAPLSQCWLWVRGRGWPCSLQVSVWSLSKPVSPSDSPWGQGRVSGARQCSCAASSAAARDVAKGIPKLGPAVPPALLFVSLGNALLDTLYDFICGLFSLLFFRLKWQSSGRAGKYTSKFFVLWGFFLPPLSHLLEDDVICHCLSRELTLTSQHWNLNCLRSSGEFFRLLEEFQFMFHASLQKNLKLKCFQTFFAFCQHQHKSLEIFGGNLEKYVFCGFY